MLQNLRPSKLHALDTTMSLRFVRHSSASVDICGLRASPAQNPASSNYNNVLWL
ncbi:MAG: hypothetical protein O3A66_01505 [Proteobacteria bacterium]|nr:hypothetical protein [Pseudomonadota bacterium]